MSWPASVQPRASGTRGSASPNQSSSPSPMMGSSSSGMVLQARSRDIGSAVLGRDAEEVEDRALDRAPRREAEPAARTAAIGDAQVEQEIEERRRRADELSGPLHLRQLARDELRHRHRHAAE